MKTASNAILRSGLCTIILCASQACAADKDENNDNKDKLAHGEEIHQNHCYKCHGDEVYTRDDRFVKSLSALSKQVERCKNSNDLPWFDDDTDAVVNFLNTRYYKF